MNLDISKLQLLESKCNTDREYVSIRRFHLLIAQWTFMVLQFLWLRIRRLLNSDYHGRGGECLARSFTNSCKVGRVLSVFTICTDSPDYVWWVGYIIYSSVQSWREEKLYAWNLFLKNLKHCRPLKTEQQRVIRNVSICKPDMTISVLNPVTLQPGVNAGCWRWLADARGLSQGLLHSREPPGRLGSVVHPELALARLTDCLGPWSDADGSRHYQ